MLPRGQLKDPNKTQGREGQSTPLARGTNPQHLTMADQSLQNFGATLFKYGKEQHTEYKNREARAYTAQGSAYISRKTAEYTQDLIANNSPDIQEKTSKYLETLYQEVVPEAPSPEALEKLTNEFFIPYQTKQLIDAHELEGKYRTKQNGLAFDAASNDLAIQARFDWNKVPEIRARGHAILDEARHDMPHNVWLDKKKALDRNISYQAYLGLIDRDPWKVLDYMSKREQIDGLESKDLGQLGNDAVKSTNDQTYHFLKQQWERNPEDVEANEQAIHDAYKKGYYNKKKYDETLTEFLKSAQALMKESKAHKKIDELIEQNKSVAGEVEGKHIDTYINKKIDAVRIDGQPIPLSTHTKITNQLNSNNTDWQRAANTAIINADATDDKNAQDVIDSILKLPNAALRYKLSPKTRSIAQNAQNLIDYAQMRPGAALIKSREMANPVNKQLRDELQKRFDSNPKFSKAQMPDTLAHQVGSFRGGPGIGISGDIFPADMVAGYRTVLNSIYLDNGGNELDALKQATQLFEERKGVTSVPGNLQYTDMPLEKVMGPEQRLGYFQSHMFINQFHEFLNSSEKDKSPYKLKKDFPQYINVNDYLNKPADFITKAQRGMDGKLYLKGAIGSIPNLIPEPDHAPIVIYKGEEWMLGYRENDTTLENTLGGYCYDYILTNMKTGQRIPVIDPRTGKPANFIAPYLDQVFDISKIPPKTYEILLKAAAVDPEVESSRFLNKYRKPITRTLKRMFPVDTVTDVFDEASKESSD